MATMRMKLYALAAGLAAGVAVYGVWNSGLLQQAESAAAQEAKPAVAQAGCAATRSIFRASPHSIPS
jgi:hypothetical protein